MLKNQPTYPPRPIASRIATRSAPAAIRPVINRSVRPTKNASTCSNNGHSASTNTCRGSDSPAKRPPNRTSAARWLASILAPGFDMHAATG